MSKNALIAVCVLCIFSIGYMSWDLIAKKDSRSTELSTAEQGENMFPDMNDIATTSNTQKLDTSTVNEVSALKSGEGSSVSVDNAKNAVKVDETVTEVEKTRVNDNIKLDTQKQPEINSGNTKVVTDFENKFENCEPLMLEASVPKIGDLLVRILGVTEIVHFFRVDGVTNSDCILTMGYKMTTQDGVLSGGVDCEVPVKSMSTFLNPEIGIERNISENDLIEKISIIDIGQRLLDGKLDLSKVTLSESDLESLDSVKTYAKSITPRPYLISEEDGVSCLLTEFSTNLDDSESFAPIPKVRLSTNEIDKSIQNLFNKIRGQAELHYNKDYTYNGLCSGGQAIDSLNEAINLVNGTKFLPGTHGLLIYVATNGGNTKERTASCHVDDQSYVIATPLSENSGFWCVDSQGLSKKINMPPAAGTLTCP